MTATQGAAPAVVAALFIGRVGYREHDLASLEAAIIEGGSRTAVVMLLVAAAGRRCWSPLLVAAAGRRCWSPLLVLALLTCVPCAGPGLVHLFYR